jgi:hypothetical protein
MNRNCSGLWELWTAALFAVFQRALDARCAYTAPATSLGPPFSLPEGHPTGVGAWDEALTRACDNRSPYVATSQPLKVPSHFSEKTPRLLSMQRLRWANRFLTLWNEPFGDG